MAVRFDSSSDLLSWVGTLPAVASTGITITLWVHLSVDRDDYSLILRVAGAGTLFVLETESDGTSLWLFGSGHDFDSGQSLAVGAWRRLALTIATDGTARYWVAGPTGSPAVTVGTGPTATGSVIQLGGHPVANEWLNGRMAHARIWAAVLTQAEIEAEWASPTAVRTSGLFADWPLLAHTDLTDHSGNGRDLSAGPGAVTTEADPPTTPPEVVGALAGSAPRATGALVGAVVDPGALTAGSPRAVAALAGLVSDRGQLAGSTPAPVGGLVGALAVTGTLAGLAPAARGTLTDTVRVEAADVRAGTPMLMSPAHAGPPALAAVLRAGTPVPR